MKNALILILLIITQSFGDVFLSKGMKVFGQVDLNFPALDKLTLYLFTSPWIWLGISTLVLSLLLYMTAISRLDLSYVLPIHSFTHVLNALLALLVLGESISSMRWIATIIITIGVLIVGLSKQEKRKINEEKNWKSKPFYQDKNKTYLPFFLLPLGISLSQVWAGVLILVCADATGDVLTAVGMKQIGRVTFRSFPEILILGRQVFLNRVVMSAIACHAIGFFIFISLLSWADISLVRPATALTYVLSMLGARLFLKERMTLGRLVGISVIGGGVALIAYS